jgi:glycosyltransferase involved in cell wall biosynthesis
MSEYYPKLRILLIAPYYDKNIPGESWSTYKWVEGISNHCLVTVLSTHYEGWREIDSPTQAMRIVNWRDVALPARFSRINHEMAPGYFVFYSRARKWIKDRLRSGWDFDLVHQINPLAMRYPSPAAGLGIPYVIGPLAGSLSTPPGFASEGVDKQWFRKLRHLDRLRIGFDPLLRRTYRDAEVVFGVAPYVRDILAPCDLKRFVNMSETGVEKVSRVEKKSFILGRTFRLLFVGRIIRTKGVIDAIRAVALAVKDYPLCFDIIGDGDQLEECRREVMRLGIQDIVHFHGWLPRAEVEQWYQRADVFLFPSFREPSGNVIFESLKHGLPVITSSLGGPGYVVDESCGIRVDPTSPDEYSERLSEAIRNLISHPERLMKMSEAALARLEKLAVWEAKIQELIIVYKETISALRSN